MLPASVIGLALVLERRWKALIALSLASIPGLYWLVASRMLNPLAFPVNEIARYTSRVDWFWNPELYTDPWWIRNLGYMFFDVLGIFGLVAIGAAFLYALRRKWTFEWIVLAGPPIILAIVFPIHSASHGEYHLMWLPLALVCIVEVGFRAVGNRLDMPRFWVLLLGVCILASLGVSERALGLVERATGYHTGGLLWQIPNMEADAQRVTNSLTALTETTQDQDLIGYFGMAGLWTFPELGRRGWVVHDPPKQADYEKWRVPSAEYLEQVEEWRRVDADWFADRRKRGMSVVLIEMDSSWDSTRLMQMAEAAEFGYDRTVAQHIVLRSAIRP